MIKTILGAVEPTPEQIKHFLADSPAGQPVYMLNLLKFKDKATYHDGEDVSGRIAYERYATAFMDISKPYGAQVTYSGNVGHLLIGQDDIDGEGVDGDGVDGDGRGLWDAVAVIQYPDAQTMIDAVSNEAYRAIYKHRKAGLAHQLLISCESVPLFAQKE